MLWSSYFHHAKFQILLKKINIDVYTHRQQICDRKTLVLPFSDDSDLTRVPCLFLHHFTQCTSCEMKTMLYCPRGQRNWEDFTGDLGQSVGSFQNSLYSQKNLQRYWTHLVITPNYLVTSKGELLRIQNIVSFKWRSF